MISKIQFSEPRSGLNLFSSKWPELPVLYQFCSLVQWTVPGTRTFSNQTNSLNRCIETNVFCRNWISWNHKTAHTNSRKRLESNLKNGAIHYFFVFLPVDWGEFNIEKNFVFYTLAELAKTDETAKSNDWKSRVSWNITCWLAGLQQVSKKFIWRSDPHLIFP